ncbi:hypothetical protein VTO58DRAFT_103071 [Aureobasidium pullulans]
MFQNSHNDDRECLPQPYTLRFESASSSTYVNHTSPILGPIMFATRACAGCGRMVISGKRCGHCGQPAS